MKRRLLDRILAPSISPMVYLTMFISLFIGFCFATGFVVNANQSVLYGSGVLIEPHLWGIILAVTAIVCLVGMIMKKDRLVQLGGMAGFMVWLFACISVTLAGHVYILVTVAGFHFLFHGYVYLASTMGLLRPLDSTTE